MYDERVEIRLRGWARYVIDLELGNEGYPKKSVISLFADGFGLREEFKSICLITDDRAQQTGYWLVLMGRIYPHEYEAVVFHYLSTKTPREICEALCISKRTFYQRLLGAKVWLSGCISRHDSIEAC